MSDTKPSYHPDLVRAAARLPRVTVRRWSLPVWRVIDSTVGLINRGGERIDLEQTSVWLYRPTAPSPTSGPAVLCPGSTADALQTGQILAFAPRNLSGGDLQVN